MFDLNAIVSAAISAAITEATKPLLERIATLESANDILHKTQHEAMVAMRDRITALEDTGDRLYARIAVLENNPAQGVDTQAAPTTDITQYIINALSDIEHPLFKRLSSFMDAVAEQSMDHHLECYDHDSYDEAASKVYETDFDEFMTSDNLTDAINEALEQATIRISI